MAFTTTILKFLLLFFIERSLGNALPQPVIVEIAGGHAVDIEDAPYMAHILRQKQINDTTIEQTSCGGSIVHERFVLTAAHCLTPLEDAMNTIVGVGSSQLNEVRLYYVENYFIHKRFLENADTRWGYDFALLKLTESVTFGSTVSKIQLADESFNITTGLNANVTGWGRTGPNTEDSEQLQQLTVTVLDPEYCHFPPSDMQICTSMANNTQGCCHGDSGGPLSVGDVQIGIVSLFSVCVYHQNNLYVKVAPHIQWIQDKIKTNL